MLAPTRTVDRMTLSEILETQRAAFLADGIPDAQTRVDRINRLQAMLLDNAETIVAALREDFGSRPREVSLNGDVIACMADLDHQKKNLASWMGTSIPATILNRLGLRYRVRHDPKGVVGVVG
ncbi:coniferyl aldehyde dehydrogenase, partial [Rhizobium leguminosarum]|nr:coniferyl aldehyde dehydrogenase [Rhizobium ruizarguesonis]